MIQRLRLKFTAIYMVLTSILVAVLLSAVMVSARENLEQMSRDVLFLAMKAEPGRPGIVKSDRRMALPYFTVDRLGGAAYLSGGNISGPEDTETLEAIVNDCLSRPEPEGVLTDYGLRYLRREFGWHGRIVFVDMSIERAALRDLFASWLVIALIALIPLLALSVLLSGWAVAPVERAWRQQRQFLSDASHELKTPLTVILSNADLLDAADLPDRPRRWADNIRSESRRMRTLVEEMLSLARAESAEGRMVPGEVSLSDIAADCALSFEPVAFEAGKPLQYEIAPGVLAAGDGEKLRRLVSVLLDNAIKYGAEGGAITLTLERTSREARLTVSNPGEPIPPEILSRLFERFYRGDASRGEKSGFGLGLSIAAAIAHEHRGTLRAESDAVSTRFLYSMPLARPARNRGDGKSGADSAAEGEAARRAAHMEAVPDTIPDRIPEQMLEQIPERMPPELPDTMPKVIPEALPESIPEGNAGKPK